MQKPFCITHYNAICNIGDDIESIFENAVSSDCDFLTKDNEIISGQSFYFGKVNTELPEIKNDAENLRCNKLLLHLMNKISDEINALIEKYGKTRVGVVVATTNSGINEYEVSHNTQHFEIGNPAEFIKNCLGLKCFYESVSTACSSGIKIFSTAQKLLNNNICDAVIVAGVDSLAKVPIYGFNSLEVLSNTKTNPFSKNRNGINIGEAAAIFLIEKSDEGVLIKGIGETSDAYHSATPDPEATEAVNAINISLEKSDLKADNIDYINLHGTGTVSNDLMEANAINKVFGNSCECSSTKPLTGHCLGAAAAIEIALCCKVLEKQILLPHIFDGEYDLTLPQINLVTQPITKNVKNVLCTSFGFGGTNAAIVLGRK